MPGPQDANIQRSHTRNEITYSGEGFSCRHKQLVFYDDIEGRRLHPCPIIRAASHLCPVHLTGEDLSVLKFCDEYSDAWRQAMTKEFHGLSDARPLRTPQQPRIPNIVSA